MMSWSSTARRSSGFGLAVLWSHPEWRDSAYAGRIRETLRTMLSDEDEVQRLHAAQVLALLDPDRANTLALIQERLAAETHPHVAATLMMVLGNFRSEHADEVDRIVAESAVRKPWTDLLGTGTPDGDRDAVDSLVSLVLWLAIRPRTPKAVAMAQRWFDAPLATEAGRRCMWLVRDWLALPPGRADERRRAFEFARMAATALRAAIENTDDQTLLKAAYQSADVLSNIVYFASGAFGDKGQNPTDPPEGFAEEAFDLLDILAGFRHPSIVHHIVETASHLASHHPKRAFAVIHSAVRPGEPYSYDKMAADVTVSLIERYLADFRETVVGDHEMLSEVRTVLDAFVRVGWPSAVSLSYRLAEAFR